jgi:addiction module HigA family antidote
MIKSFACRDTEKLFNDQRVRRFQSFERQARKRLMVLHAAPSLEALMLNPGNKFHSMKGDRKGQYAISINKQWRVCFEWHSGNALNTQIVDYHWGKNMNTNKLLDPITPGEILREDFMDQLGISINKLSRDLSVPPNRISAIVNGKRAITADTALRLQRYFGVEAQFWLNLQTEYDLRIMKRKIWTDIERRIIPVKTSETLSENSPMA